MAFASGLAMMPGSDLLCVAPCFAVPWFDVCCRVVVLIYRVLVFRSACRRAGFVVVIRCVCCDSLYVLAGLNTVLSCVLE